MFETVSLCDLCTIWRRDNSLRNCKAAPFVFDAIQFKILTNFNDQTSSKIYNDRRPPKAYKGADKGATVVSKGGGGGFQGGTVVSRG